MDHYASNEATDHLRADVDQLDGGDEGILSDTLGSQRQEQSIKFDIVRKSVASKREVLISPSSAESVEPNMMGARNAQKSSVVKSGDGIFLRVQVQ